MTPREAKRRDFLKVVAGTAAASAVLTVPPRHAAAAEITAGQKGALKGIDSAFQQAVDAGKIPGVVAMAAIGRHASRQANGRRRRVMGVQFRGKGRCIDSRRSTAWPPSAAAAAATQAGSGVGATNGTFTIPKLRIVSPPD